MASLVLNHIAKHQCQLSISGKMNSSRCTNGTCVSLQEQLVAKSKLHARKKGKVFHNGQANFNDVNLTVSKVFKLQPHSKTNYKKEKSIKLNTALLSTERMNHRCHISDLLQEYL